MIRARALTTVIAAFALTTTLAACGGGTQLIKGEPQLGAKAQTPQAGEKLGFPTVATKNTTRVAGSDPTADAAGVALAVFPSNGAGTHPTAVTIAPTDDWQAALASAVLMSSPIRAPILLSGSGSLPSATADALKVLAPTGSGAAGGEQVLRVGDVATPGGLRSAPITGKDPYALAAAIDRFQSAARGKTSSDVMIASAENADAPYAMPAAGLAAESGDPILFVNHTSVPQATRQALLSHQNPRIFLIGPPTAIPETIVAQLRKYGKVERAGAVGAAANSVAVAEYRYPACPYGAACAHIPGSFGWAMRSPGHGYILLNASRTLDAAASAPLSASGDYGPQLLVTSASTLAQPVLNFFLNFATPGYTAEGPTAAVYNHGWVIGDETAVSTAVQAQMDLRLEVVPQTSSGGSGGGSAPSSGGGGGGATTTTPAATSTTSSTSTTPTTGTTG